MLMVELAEYCPPRPLDYLISLSYRHRLFRCAQASNG
jgi:hypothetical protein